MSEAEEATLSQSVLLADLLDEEDLDDEKKEVHLSDSSVISEGSEEMSVKKEEKLADYLMCMSLELFPETKWIEVKRTEEVNIQYAYDIKEDDSSTSEAGKKASIATICGQTTVEDFSPKDYFDFMEDSTEDLVQFMRGNDPMCEELTVVKRLDSDRTVLYSRFNAGSWAAKQVVWNRDFCYMTRRMYFEDRTVTHLPDGRKLAEPLTFAQMTLGLSYSLPESHPNYVPTGKRHVRGHIEYAGYCFFREKHSDTGCRMVYLGKADPKGWIPAFAVNVMAPKQALVCTVVKKNIGIVQKVLLQRRTAESDSKTGDEKDVEA